MKDSVVGLIPNDWNCVRLGEVFEHSRKKGEYGLPVLSVTITKGLLVRADLDRRMGNSLPPEKSLHVRIDDIAYNMMRMWQGAVAYCDREGVVSPSYVVCRPKASKSDARFMYHVFKSHHGMHKLFCYSHGITSDRLRLYFQDFATIPIALPPVREQCKIAGILFTWDKMLEQLGALITAKERRKTALMQQLLTQRKRLNGFSGKWKSEFLGSLTEEVAIPNRNRLGTEWLYAVTKADGMVPMREQVKGSAFHRCNLVERDWFAYNPMRINIGSIARWQGADPVMVSPDYVVFRCKPAKLSPRFLDHLRRTWRWQQFVGMAGDGSVRVRIYFDRLAEFAFPCPPLGEQQAIAAVLDACDEELRLLRAQRAAVDQQKRGLMQRLLTGRLRVRV